MNEFDTQTNEILYSIKFYDLNYGVSVGINGTIYQTTDGGNNWVKRFSGTNYSLMSVDLADYKGITVGYGGIILRIDTILGYNIYFNWEKIETNDSYNLNSVYFNDKNSDWAAGSGGIVITTTDNGTNWKLLKNEISSNISKIFFIDSLYGFFTSSNLIMKTTDGGISWDTSYNYGYTYAKHATFFSIYFTDKLYGWTIGDFFEQSSFRYLPIIIRTEDGGVSWKNVWDNGAPTQIPQDIFFIDKNNGWITFSPFDNYVNVLRTTDGGVSWKSIEPAYTGSPFNGSYSSVYFLNNNLGWIIASTSEGGLLCKTVNGGDSWIIFKPFGYKEYFDKIKFVDENSGWMKTSYTNAIYESNDGGNTWDTSLSNILTTISDISFPDRNDGWAVGSNGTIFKFTFKEPKIDDNLWKDDISVESKIASKTVTFGKSPQASDGIDSALGETELSYPSLGILDLRFDLPTKVSSVNDFRNSSQNKITWKLKFQPDTSGYPLTFIWNKYALLEGSFLLKDTITGNIVNIDMKSYGNFELNDTSINSLYIEHTFNYVPVELTSFGCKILNNTVKLNWKTATETNNKGFEIQRKLNSNWEKIGYVRGNGTTTTPNEYTYTDNFKYDSDKGIISYRLKQIDLNGSFHYSDEIKLKIDFTPKEFTLYQNYPNPFNPTTTIKYALPFESSVDITIYNMIGQRIEDFKEGIKEAGYHNINWQPNDLSSGVYFYSINAKSTDGKNNYSKTLKMLYMK